MDVLLIAPQPFYTERGTPIAVRAVVEELAAAGHRVDVLTYHHGDNLAIEGVQIVRSPRLALVRRVPIGPSWQKAACDVGLWRRAQQLLASKRYDVIHAVEEAAFMARGLGRKFGVPYIYDMDSLMSEQLRDKGLPFSGAAPAFYAMERRAIREAAGVLAVCPFLVEHARRIAPPGVPVHLLPDFPVEGVAGAAADPEIAAITGLKFVYVGNLEPYQGVDLMLEAFAVAARQVPQARLVVVGGAAEAVKRYQGRWRELSASGRVHLLGSRPPARLGGILAAADVLVSPRLKGHNTPMKIYSYLASGRPVLATDLPTHRQVVDSGTAMLVAAEPQAMAAGMQSLAADAALRQRLGAAGAALAESEYGRDRFRQRLLDFYRRLFGHDDAAARQREKVQTAA